MPAWLAAPSDFSEAVVRGGESKNRLTITGEGIALHPLPILIEYGCATFITVGRNEAKKV